MQLLESALVGRLARVATGGLLVTAAAAPLAAQGPPCSTTAAVARQASLRDARASFWNEIGVCLNLSDPIDALECVQDALTALEEALEEVEGQYAARLALCLELGEGPYDPELEPEDFTSVVTNAYFPLVPNTTLVYEGMTEDGLERVECTTLEETREILGVECAVVEALEFVDGELVEDTRDYYAQDEAGNVWYFGELSFELEDGFVANMDGSWIAGVDGAKAGIIMQAVASPGLVYRQEWFLNEAEDIGTFLATDQTITTPLGGGTTFAGCWQLQDTTPIEPDALEYKYYAPGVGLVRALSVESGEVVELVDVLTN